MIAFILTAMLQAPLDDLHDFQRFPPVAVCISQFHTANNFWREIQAKQGLVGPWHSFQLNGCHDDAWLCKEFWKAAFSIHDWRNRSFESQKRCADRMREIAGHEAYWSGNWPPAIPYWWLPRE